VVFFASFAPSPLALAPIIGFVVFGYLLILYGSGRLAWLSIGSLLALFVILKKYTVIPEELFLPFPYVVVGLSYILFRILHLIVDSHGDPARLPISFRSYLAYVFLFLNYNSGPIQRYEDYSEQIRAASSVTSTCVSGALSLMATGFLKALVVAPMLFYEFTQLQDLARTSGDSVIIGRLPGWLVPIFSNGNHEVFLRPLLIYSVMIPVYFIYLYVNFSAYMDIVIGAGRLFGYQVAENFYHPFRAENLLDFWARWHITLSSWFKFYLFNPLLKACAERISSRAAMPFLAVLAFFVTFLVMGIWHGSTAAFVVYGVFLGAGVSLNRLYQVLAQQMLGRPRYAALRENLIYAYCCRALALASLSVSLICFWNSSVGLLDLWKLFGLWGGLLVLVAVAGLTLVYIIVLDAIVFVLACIRPSVAALSDTPTVVDVTTALKFLAAVYYISASTTAIPEFVYKAY
jgi:alginate O-acetyltransferase complex protein AlgI